MSGSTSDRAPQPQRLFQPSFAGGELAPGLHRRSDMAQWRIGLAATQNVIITAQGGATRRAGTEYVTYARTGLGTQNRLIPFQFSTDQQFIIEFGPLYIRLIQFANVVRNNDGSDYVVTTPYAGADIPMLKTVQSADVLTITHGGYQPMNLKRYGALDWRLEPVAIGSRLQAPTGCTVTAQQDNAPTGSPAPSMRGFTYAVTASSSAVPDESGLSNQSSCSNYDLGYYTTFGVRNQLTWNAVAGATFYSIYRYYDGGWARVGRTTATAFQDTNFLPDTANAPPQALNPFAGGNWPGAVGYFQQRRIYAGSFSAPETMWLSKTANYDNFDVADPVRDDDAITYTLAARQVNQVRHLIPLNDLIVMTSGGGWKVSSGAGTGPITPSSIEVLPQSFVGASDVTPLVIGNRVVYVEAKGSSVREIAFQFVQNQYVSEDRSVFAKHLFNGHQIVSWAYAEVPDKVLWAVRDDGVLLSLTYLAEQQVLAWTQHVMDGLVRSVAVIAEGMDGSGAIDVLYLIVERKDPFGASLLTIERMRTRRMGAGDDDVRLAWHVDCGSIYNGTPATKISGLVQFLDTQVVNYLADGVPGVAVVFNKAITLPTPASVVIIGRAFSSSMTTLPADGGHPGDDPWLGRRKRAFKVRVAMEQTGQAALGVVVDGHPPEPLTDPDTGAWPPVGLFTGVLDVHPSEGWGRNGQVTLRCDTALPFTVAGVAMEWLVEE